MRLMVLRIESTCNWSASFSSCDRPAELAALPTRPCSETSRLLTSEREPSAVPTTLLANWALLMAVVVACCSAARDWLAIKPAGSSLPELMRVPVERRCREVCRAVLFLLRLLIAINEETLVLITDIV